MVGAGALDNAERLLRNPWLRTQLREQALPADIGQLIALLGGRAERVEAAAQSLGVPADTVLEAARFYAQEVMLFRGADDRRVLGLRDDDGIEVARANLRALLAWLHPDRMADAAESVFATRVNVAWRRLRAPEAQLAESVAHAELQSDHVVRIPRWQPMDEAPAAHRGLLPGLVVVMLLMCGGLLWLSLRNTPVPELPTLTLTDVVTPAQGDAGTTLAAVALSRHPQRTKLHAAPAGAAAPAKLADLQLSEPATEPLPAPSRPVAAGTAALMAPLPARVAVADTQPLAVELSKPTASIRNPVLVPVTQRDPVTTGRPVARTTQPAAARRAPPPDVATPVLDDRLGQAQQRAQRLLDYVMRPKAAIPPIWRNGAALAAAEAAHAEINKGSNVFKRPRVLEQQAHWVLGLDEMTLRVPVQPAARDAEVRQLRATLRWHEGEWWVSAVDFEKAP